LSADNRRQRKYFDLTKVGTWNKTKK